MAYGTKIVEAETLDLISFAYSDVNGADTHTFSMVADVISPPIPGCISINVALEQIDINCLNVDVGTYTIDLTITDNDSTTAGANILSTTY